MMTYVIRTFGRSTDVYHMFFCQGESLVRAMSSAFCEVASGGQGLASVTCSRETTAYPALVCPAEIWVELLSMNQVYRGWSSSWESTVRGQGKGPPETCCRKVFLGMYRAKGNAWLGRAKAGAQRRACFKLERLG